MRTVGLSALVVLCLIVGAAEAGIFGRRCSGGSCRVQYAPRAKQAAPARATPNVAPEKPAPTEPEVGPPPLNPLSSAIGSAPRIRAMTMKAMMPKPPLNRPPPPPVGRGIPPKPPPPKPPLA